MAKLIDGKAVSAQVKASVKAEVEALVKKGIQPGLAVVIVGDDPASRIYVNNKKKACAAAGIYSEEYALPASTTQQELLDLIRQLNEKPEINGILVQSPLPKGLDEALVVEHIDPKKDVDAFHAYNVGKIMIGDYRFLPCTPAGVIELIRSTGVEISGKECVVIGRSNIVGKPMAMLLLHNNGTVTICHSRTQNLPEVCRRADILVSAVGKAHFVTADMVKPGRRGHRRGHEPGRERQALRRRGLRRGRAHRGLHHPGARRRGAHDHRHAAEEHRLRRQAAARGTRLTDRQVVTWERSWIRSAPPKI